MGQLSRNSTHTLSVEVHLNWICVLLFQLPRAVKTHEIVFLVLNEIIQTNVNTLEQKAGCPGRSMHTLESAVGFKPFRAHLTTEFTKQTTQQFHSSDFLRHVSKIPGRREGFWIRSSSSSSCGVFPWLLQFTAVLDNLGWPRPSVSQINKIRIGLLCQVCFKYKNIR